MPACDIELSQTSMLTPHISNSSSSSVLGFVLPPSAFNLLRVSESTKAVSELDTAGRTKIITDGTDTFTYSYETDSNLLASFTAPQHTVAYIYEPNRNVMTSIDNQVSSSSLSKYVYTYDDLGRRDNRTQSGTAISTSTDDFEYNDRSEVTSSTNSVETAAKWKPSYTYDQIGNRKSSVGFQPATTYTSNELNQYVDPVSLASRHDEDGNLEKNGNWTYTWNNENRLINAVNSSTNATIDFVYDYQGRLVKKDDGSKVEVYVYDGWNRIYKTTTDNQQQTISNSYLWGLDLSGSMQGAGGVGDLYPTNDANGNIMQKLDDAGTTIMNVAYDPFGNIISGTLEGEYGFSTKPLIKNLDWYYYGFRYYDPTTGRWPSRDPIGEAGGRNVYVFVLNAVTRYIDYLGMFDCGPESAESQSLENDIREGNPNPIIDEAIKTGEELWEKSMESSDPDANYPGSEKCETICECGGSRNNIPGVSNGSGACTPASCPDGWHLVAVVHTHPDGSRPSSRDDFPEGTSSDGSFADGENSQNKNVPVFTCSGPGKHSAIVSPGSSGSIFKVESSPK